MAAGLRGWSSRTARDSAVWVGDWRRSSRRGGYARLARYNVRKLLTKSLQTLSVRLFCLPAPSSSVLPPIMRDNSTSDPSNLLFTKASAPGHVRFVAFDLNCNEHHKAPPTIFLPHSARGTLFVSHPLTHCLLQRAAGVPPQHGGGEAPVLGLTSAVSWRTSATRCISARCISSDSFFFSATNVLPPPAPHAR